LTNHQPVPQTTVLSLVQPTAHEIGLMFSSFFLSLFSREQSEPLDNAISRFLFSRRSGNWPPKVTGFSFTFSGEQRMSRNAFLISLYLIDSSIRTAFKALAPQQKSAFPQNRDRLVQSLAMTFRCGMRGSMTLE
jgi:hypothetical protein